MMEPKWAGDLESYGKNEAVSLACCLGISSFMAWDSRLSQNRLHAGHENTER